ncbi:acyl carrier protein [Stutzerimonas nitrititolerans]|uniref:acyl carrier protein n=1 Tax=Stutzerimonas nitrititolerans TaxID=2482751 RepID=UPI0028AF03C5|nr:acyl carrier protein [Stutzerimonas nitrititolerans]
MLNEQQIRDIIAGVNTNLDWATQDKNVTFAELGLDSLDRFDVLLGIQEATGVEVPDDDVESLSSIAAIEAYFADK